MTAASSRRPTARRPCTGPVGRDLRRGGSGGFGKPVRPLETGARPRQLSDKAGGRRGSAGRASFEPAGTGRVGTEGPWEGAGGWEEGGQVRPRVRAKMRRGRGGHGERGVPQAAYGGWKTGLRRLCGEFGPASALTLTPPGSEGSNCPRERRGDLGGLGVVERLTAGGDCKGESGELRLWELIDWGHLRGTSFLGFVIAVWRPNLVL